MNIFRKRSRYQIPRPLPGMLFGMLFLTTAIPISAQPDFEQYTFTNPLQHYHGDVDALYYADPKAFRATYLPKLRIPIQREDYFGVWNWRNHIGSWPGHSDQFIPYDNHPKKKTYVFGGGSGHDAVDWLVSFRNWGANEVINPFPHGARVEVTNLKDHVDDVWVDINHPDSLGNWLELTCYLDGKVDNKSYNNKFTITFAHLKKNSIVVAMGQMVEPGQVLAQVGSSGTTSLDVTHIHTIYKYRGKKLDPFNGYWNKDLSEPLLFDQGWVEQRTNYDVKENRRHLTLNNAFYVEMPNNSVNTYIFRSFDYIAHIRFGDGSGGIVPDLDILDNPNLLELKRRETTFWDKDGGGWTMHEVEFEWAQNADPSVVDKEMDFRIETSDGRLSNRVFVVVRD
ncbi:hypothetical protein SCOR_26770 [Sulfidibacter corallicola]|uniref:Peptidase family M23 n=1 Tax=Sulfidibacter corallicola TaxID=2818388 RepID=A0A8A4TP23_SULCO|nr:hypothetical protein [Sulfidibacter corallicola]QTD50842.1 hypothetical protein J3U87_00105 [Sulfidibacter corallicola]